MKHVKCTDEHTTAQSVRNQELDRKWEDHTSQITTLELDMTNRIEGCLSIVE